MRKVYGLLPSFTKLVACILVLALHSSGAMAVGQVSGYVYDLSGNPLSQSLPALSISRHRLA